MAAGGLLGIEPQELKFPFELGKQISCSILLSNRTDKCVAFKVKTTNPKKYCVRPNAGIVMPRSTCDVTVMMQAQREAPPDMQCKDKFLLQSVVANPGMNSKDITQEMFNKESGNHVEECKLRVVYVAPPKPPSPVPEGSEEDSSPPRDPLFDAADLSDNVRGFVGPQDKSSELLPSQLKVAGLSNGKQTLIKVHRNLLLDLAMCGNPMHWAKALISQLAEEKNSAVQINGRLRQELELLKREVNKKQGSFSFVFVMLIGLLGILCGYLFRSS